MLLAGIVALGVAAATKAAGQPSAEASANTAMREAGVLAARIRGFHRWQGLTPPPPDYCVTMREGEAVIKELARLSGLAVLYRRPGYSLALQAAGDPLSDALDEEEEVNQQADVKWTTYPCPTPTPHPRRAYVLAVVGPRMGFCRAKATALRVSFAARRSVMQQCLRIPGT